jgi:SAM-dependent methyltransferase
MIGLKPVPKTSTWTARRPLWKRAARSLRSLIHRALTMLDRLAPWHGDPLLPPAHLRIYYYRTWKPEAFARACASARTELELAGLHTNDRVLDIGSGIGNLAVGLIGYLKGTYDGVEIHREAVAWCRDAITPRHPTFRFHHADVANDSYNPGGGASPAEYRFPFADRSFDVIFLGSVYTHLLPADAAQYVREVARLLAPGGFCVASYFLLDDDRRKAIDGGRGFIPFPVEHSSGLCRLHRASAPESAVAFEESFIRRLHDESGLRIHHIRRGQWWSGVADDQDVVVAGHAGDAAGWQTTRHDAANMPSPSFLRRPEEGLVDSDVPPTAGVSIARLD